MEIIKFALIAIVGVIIFVYLKSVNSELSALSLCATGIILILTLLPYVLNALNLFSNFGFEAGVSAELFSVVIKIIIISYLIEFVENLCSDLGASSISTKVSIAGKIIILLTSTPVFTALFNVISNFVK